MASYLLISHLCIYHFCYFDRFYVLFNIFIFIFTNTPCATTSTWDIPLYTTKELLFFPTFSTPVYLFHIQFSFVQHSNNPTSSHLQKKLLSSVARLEASVYQVFRLFVILHNVCFTVCNASISGTSCTNFSSRAFIKLTFFSYYWQHFLLLPSTLLRALCKHSFFQW